VGTSILLAVLLVVGAGGWLYLRWRLGQINRVQLPALDEDRGSVMNVLLVGSDSRSRLTGDLAEQAGKDQVSGQRSDTMMVLHVDSRQRKAAILSIPRDLYVRIAGTNRSDRINTAFAAGGAQGLIQTIQENLSFPIHHYMEVDFVGFRDIVNTVGGVKVYVPAPARDTMSGLDIKEPGCIRFDGDQALAWVRSRNYEYFESGRWRKDGTADLGRIQRQQDFIRRMMRRAVSSGLTNPLTLNRIIGIGVEDVTLDEGMSTSDLVRVARRFRSLDPETVDMQTLPTTPATIGGASVLRLDREKAQAAIDRLNGAGDDPADARPSEVRVRVLNGNGTDGAAAAAAEALGGVGFNVADQGDADNYSYRRTLIRHAIGQRAKADLLARHLQAGATVREDASLRTIDATLVLGSDFSGVRASPAAPAAPPPTAAPPSAPAQPNTAATPAPKGAPTEPAC
jgi:LCP family protein required for cell wall assembly